MEVNNNRIFNANNWGNTQYADVKKYILPGKNVMTANGHNGVSLAGFLAELRLTDKDGNSEFICTDSSWLVNNSNPGANWRRVNPPQETKKGWLPAKELGLPPVGPWGNAVKFCEKMPEPLNSTPIDKEAFAKRKNTYAVGELNGYPILEINGEKNQPIIFGLRWKGDRTENYRTAKASGFKVFRLVWEVAFEAWQPDGTVNMSTLDKEVEELLRAEPDAKILLMPGMVRITPISSLHWWVAPSSPTDRQLAVTMVLSPHQPAKSGWMPPRRCTDAQSVRLKASGTATPFSATCHAISAALNGSCRQSTTAMPTTASHDCSPSEISCVKNTTTMKAPSRPPGRIPT